MPTYSLDFSETLLFAAKTVAEHDWDHAHQDVARSILYLGSLAAEITLKALLEKAGMSVADIKKRRHSLKQLLDDLAQCEIRIIHGEGRTWCWASARRAWTITVDKRFANATVRTLLTVEEKRGSRYPDQLRYGEFLRDYPPKLKLAASQHLLCWAREHFDTIRISPRR